MSSLRSWGLKSVTPINRPCLLATHGAQPNACAARDLLPQGRLMGQLELKKWRGKILAIFLVPQIAPLIRFAFRNPRGAIFACTTRDLLLQNLSIGKFVESIPQISPFTAAATCELATV